MLLPREQALRFIEGYKSILFRVLSDADAPRTGSINEDLATARALVHANPSLIDAAVTRLTSESDPIEPTVVAAMRTLRFRQWVYLRHTKTFAVFLDKEIKNAYAVRALTTPLNELLDEPPFIFEAGVLEFEGHFICDGLILNPIALGRGYRAELNAAYTSIRKAGNFYARADA
ncbi:hypothetical protein [Xanthomonas medicagonis]|uniref:hypothetical protein n=1 Tax=Xanthomonas medicagonis TaxID=3160841 RepID=UPI003511AE82